MAFFALSIPICASSPTLLSFCCAHCDLQIMVSLFFSTPQLLAHCLHMGEHDVTSHPLENVLASLVPFCLRPRLWLGGLLDRLHIVQLVLSLTCRSSTSGPENLATSLLHPPPTHQALGHTHTALHVDDRGLSPPRCSGHVLFSLRTACLLHMSLSE